MPAKRVLIGFGVDVDAVAGWSDKFHAFPSSAHKFPRLGSYGGEDSPLDISRARMVETCRLKRLNKTILGNVRGGGWGTPLIETF